MSKAEAASLLPVDGQGGHVYHARLTDFVRGKSDDLIHDNEPNRKAS
jgi:hypothetical protein